MRVIKPENGENIQTTRLRIGVGMAGNIAIGDTKISERTGRPYPVAIDYFRVRTQVKEYENAFIKAYGEKPNSLKICFMTEDENFNCNNTLELRNDAGKKCAYGDGQTFFIFYEEKWMKRSHEEILQNPKNQGSVEVFKQNMLKHYGIQKQKWREKLELRFAIMGFGIYAYWQVSTFGDNTSIPNILTAYDSLLNTYGRVSMIPLDLNVKMGQSDKAGNNDRYPVLDLICNVSLESTATLVAYLSAGNKVTGLLDEAFLESVENRKKTLLLENGTSR